MFIDNIYKERYFKIIKQASDREYVPEYTEKHHIIPKSLGGSNDPDNLAVLTPREHFICHRLLTKFTKGDNKRKMLHALGKFVQSGPGQRRELTSRQYEVARCAIIDAKTGIPRSEETKKKISKSLKGNTPWNKGINGHPSQTWSDESKRKLSETNTGRKMSNTAKANMSKAKKGHTAGMTGKAHSDETKALMSKNMKGKRGPQKRIDICPHCGTEQVTNRHIKYCKGT